MVHDSDTQLDPEDFPLHDLISKTSVRRALHRWPKGAPGGRGGEFRSPSAHIAIGDLIPAGRSSEEVGPDGKRWKVTNLDPTKSKRAPRAPRRKKETGVYSVSPSQRPAVPPRRRRAQIPGETPSDRATNYERARDAQAGVGTQHRLPVKPGNRQKITSRTAIITLTRWPEGTDAPRKPMEAKVLGRKRGSLATERLATPILMEMHERLRRRIEYLKKNTPPGKPNLKLIYYVAMLKEIEKDKGVAGRIEKSTISALRGALAAASRWEDSLHPRTPKGAPGAGRFTNKPGSGSKSKRGRGSLSRTEPSGRQLSTEHKDEIDARFEQAMKSGKWDKFLASGKDLGLDRTAMIYEGRGRRDTYFKFRDSELDRAFSDADGDQESSAWRDAVKRFAMKPDKAAEEWQRRVDNPSAKPKDDGSDTGDDGSTATGTKTKSGTKSSSSSSADADPDPEPPASGTADGDGKLDGEGDRPAPPTDDDAPAPKSGYKIPGFLVRRLQAAFDSAAVKKKDTPSAKFKKVGHDNGLTAKQINAEWNRMLGDGDVGDKPDEPKPKKAAAGKKKGDDAPEPPEPKPAPKQDDPEPAPEPKAKPKKPKGHLKPLGDKYPDDSPAARHLADGGDMDSAPASGLADFVLAHPERFKMIKHNKGGPNSESVSEFFIVTDKDTGKNLFFKRTGYNFNDDGDTSAGDLAMEGAGAALSDLLGLKVPRVFGASDPNDYSKTKKKNGLNEGMQWARFEFIDEDFAPDADGDFLDGGVADVAFAGKPWANRNEPLFLSMLDYVMGNDDRHRQNWKEYVDKDGNRHLVPFDFGAASTSSIVWGFNEYTDADGVVDVDALMKASFEDFVYSMSGTDDNRGVTEFNTRPSRMMSVASNAFDGDEAEIRKGIEDFLKRMGEGLGPIKRDRDGTAYFADAGKSAEAIHGYNADYELTPSADDAMDDDSVFAINIDNLEGFLAERLLYLQENADRVAKVIADNAEVDKVNGGPVKKKGGKK